MTQSTSLLRILICALAVIIFRISAQVVFVLPGLGRDLGSSGRKSVQLRSKLEPEPGRRSALLTGLGGLLSASVIPSEQALAISKQEMEVANLFIQTSPSVLSVSDVPDSRKGVISLGSGFVWDASHVVTNFHVIEGIKKPHVTFLSKDEDGYDQHITVSTYVVGQDKLSDIAVLQVNMEDPQAQAIQKMMSPLPRGTSETIKPGQEVFALGNPFGLEHSMSRGIVSGVSRTMEGPLYGRSMNGIIQTDASVNPGNSGGPLVDSKGHVVGINTAILSRSGTFAGVGLAVPIDTVAKNVNSMMEDGWVSRPSLGVVFAPGQMADSLGVPGAMVLEVEKGGPAQKAGLRAMSHGQLGDVIVSIGDRKISDPSDVFTCLDQKAPGQDILMRVQRASADADSDRFDFVDLKVRLGTSNSKLVMT